MRSKLAIFFLPFCAVLAQTPCDSSLKPIQPRGATIFSPEQEGFLGEAVTEQMQRGLPVYRQPGLTDPLDRIAARLQPYLPGSAYRFQFSLIELAQTNAFSIPGGRIFVSRKLVEFVRNEDELAGVLAHEMGHVVARQASVDISKMFSDVLKVGSVGDRQDVFRKFNQLMDAAGRRPANATRAEDDQLVADRALAAAWRAGYDPQGLPEFLDRVTGNQGATGNFFTDLFGTTRPESKRLREMLKEVELIPAACRETRGKTGDEEFRAWQKKVAELSPEDLIAGQSGRSPKMSLHPRLMPEIINLRFSPDGRLLIAQDETGIDVLQREPLSFLFRIPALGARAALFGADSKHMIFVSTSSRIEVWNLETQTRERRWEPNDSLHCRSLIPSPDGRVAACVSIGSSAEVRLLDMGNNSELAHHSMAMPPRTAYESIFSPDGSAFLFSIWTNAGSSWAFNITRGSEISIGNPLKSALSARVAFMGPDQVVVVDRRDPKSSGVFAWPGGKQIEKLVIPDQPLVSVTKGPVVLLRPFNEYAVAALNVNDKQIFQVSMNPTLDRYDDLEAAERKTGEIALYSGRKSEPVATLQLPEADLGRVQSAALSTDLKWLAASVQNRGAVWNLESGQALSSVPFIAAHISPEGVLTGTFEETEPGSPGGKRFLTRETIDLQSAKAVSKIRLPNAERGPKVVYTDKYEVTLQTAATPDAMSSIEVKDATAGTKLWSLELEESHRFALGDAMVLQHPPKSKAAEQFLKSFPGLKDLLEEAQNRENAAVLEVRDLDTGKQLGGAVVEGGAGLAIRSIRVAGRTLFVEETNNRTLAYSLDTGDRRGQQFGRVLAINSARGLVAIENQAGKIAIFDSGMQALADFSYPGEILHAGFDSQGKRLLVLTSKEEVFVDDLP
jgi:hypothetical protein